MSMIVLALFLVLLRNPFLIEFCARQRGWVIAGATPRLNSLESDEASRDSRDQPHHD